MSGPNVDPVLRSSRREAAVTLLVFTAALVYTVVYCSRHGYDRPVESLTFVLGFPDWVFWGILVPWGVCTVVSCAMSFAGMADHALEEAAPPADLPADEEARLG